MTKKVIHVSHCVHTGVDIDYEWAKNLGTEYHQLPNLYAISLVPNVEHTKNVLATVIVKTNLGQSKEEIKELFSGMVQTFPKLQSLPNENVRLISTKINLESGVMLDRDELLDVMTTIYLQNSSVGNA